MHARTLLVWIAVGLSGLALAAGVTYAATQLSSQRIGLSGEPPSAGQELAPHGPRTSALRRAGAAGDTRGGARGHRTQERAQHRRGSRNPDD